MKEEIVGVLTGVDGKKTVYLLERKRSIYRNPESLSEGYSSEDIKKHLKKYGRRVRDDWTEGKTLKSVFLLFVEGGYYEEFEVQ